MMLIFLSGVKLLIYNSLHIMEGGKINNLAFIIVQLGKRLTGISQSQSGAHINRHEPRIIVAHDDTDGLSHEIEGYDRGLSSHDRLLDFRETTKLRVGDSLSASKKPGAVLGIRASSSPIAGATRAQKNRN